MEADVPVALTMLAADPNAWSLATIAVWLGGLLCGALLMASLTTDWQRLPQHLRIWARALRAQSGWAMLAAGSVAVLVFY
jgi:hypothetical protein